MRNGTNSNDDELIYNYPGYTLIQGRELDHIKGRTWSYFLNIHHGDTNFKSTGKTAFTAFMRLLCLVLENDKEIHLRLFTRHASSKGDKALMETWPK